ncbi:MAG: hypothetical protein V4671_06935, partial [Armatimonadota bacterium]
LSDFRGKVVVLDLIPEPWYTTGEWLTEMTQDTGPLIATSEMSRRLRDRPAVVLALLVQEGNESGPKEFDVFKEVERKLASKDAQVRILRTLPGKSASPLLSEIGSQRWAGTGLRKRYVIGADGTLYGDFRANGTVSLNDVPGLDRVIDDALKP